MAKRTLKGRTKLKGTVGKTLGRSHGPLVFNETVNGMVTQKIDQAIKNRRKVKAN